MSNPRTFILTIPVRLAVEAGDIAEARAQMFRLWQDVAAGLPVGAKLIETEEFAKAHITRNTVG